MDLGCKSKIYFFKQSKSTVKQAEMLLFRAWGCLIKQLKYTQVRSRNLRVRAIALHGIYESTLFSSAPLQINFINKLHNWHEICEMGTHLTLEMEAKKEQVLVSEKKIFEQKKIIQAPIFPASLCTGLPGITGPDLRNEYIGSGWNNGEACVAIMWLCQNSAFAGALSVNKASGGARSIKERVPSSIIRTRSYSSTEYGGKNSVISMRQLPTSSTWAVVGKIP